MNCVEWEERIALYAGGDLARDEAQAVEGHIAGCSGCQVLLSGLRQSLDLVRQAHEEPLDAAHFAAVRARVLAEIEQAPARRWRWAWWFAAAAAAVVLFLVTMRPSTPVRKPVEQAMAPAPVPPPVVVPAPAAVAPQAVRHVVRRRPAPQVARRLPQEPAHQMVVKLLTDDPNVVIYWITGTKGE